MQQTIQRDEAQTIQSSIQHALLLRGCAAAASTRPSVVAMAAAGPTAVRGRVRGAVRGAAPYAARARPRGGSRPTRCAAITAQLT